MGSWRGQQGYILLNSTFPGLNHRTESRHRRRFNNAKSRFWAEINGLHCSISLPDPDIYIDDIDWNSSIDPELVLDLEREPKPSDDKTQEDASFSCTGWGDEEEDFKNKENPENWNRGWNEDNKENPWEPVSAQSKAAVGGWDNNWENNASEWKNNTGGPNNMYYRRTDGAFGGKSDANSRKKEVAVGTTQDTRPQDLMAITIRKIEGGERREKEQQGSCWL
ncbi:uncharacterized protein Pyn_17734 [Prunus yedoensis var. nudiflora]|uniref:Uncharacterized protein n=1 Tax=Prunus yedoensis var. nudiflora TaxID=2094558 RepID=A0A314YWA4_PRUYE|nr:uncharacterized protein Pyn_17734 [Prunus yedoensis var. nudiflora]